MYLLVNEADVAVGMQEGLVGHALHDEVLVAIDLSIALALPSGLLSLVDRFGEGSRALHCLLHNVHGVGWWYCCWLLVVGL
jgi:hypothetical protein